MFQSNLRTAALTATVAWTALGGPGIAAAAERAQMITAPVGSMVNTVGSAIASVVSRNTDVAMGTSAMSGPQIMVPQTNNAPGAFTLLNAADAFHAMRGVEPHYRQKFTNLRLVSVGFSNPLGVIVPARSDIASMADLRGKRVTGVFSAHKTCEQLASAQLANAGLTWSDVKVVPVTHSQQAALAIAEGRADAALCIPVGQAVVKEVNAQTPIRFLSMNTEPAAVKKTRDIFPAGSVATFKKGSSEGVLSDVAVWSYPFYLVAHQAAADEVVAKVAKAVTEHIDELRQISPVFRTWDVSAMAQDDVTIPYHDGAVSYYREKGVWTPAMDAANEKLLQETKALAAR